MLDAATLLFFPALMIFAAISDLFTMTISNRVSIALVVLFIVSALFAGLPFETIVLNISCGTVILVVTFALFAAGWIGGGDAKLAAATAVWLGWAHVLDYGLSSSVLGGLLTLVIIQLRKLPLPSWIMAREWVARLHDRDNGVPYGIALAAAGLFVYPDTSIWLAMVGA